MYYANMAKKYFDEVIECITSTAVGDSGQILTDRTYQPSLLVTLACMFDNMMQHIDESIYSDLTTTSKDDIRRRFEQIENILTEKVR